MTHSKDDIIENLKDAGCDADTIKDFLCDLEQEDMARGMHRLEIHRKKLLDTIHENQKCIDCLDYLEYEIKKSGK